MKETRAAGGDRLQRRHDLPGPVHGAEPAAADQRRSCATRSTCTGAAPGRSGTTGSRELLDLVGLPASAADALPEPALRRPASAGGHRQGAGAGARAAHRRRADQRAGRVGAGADPQPAARSEGAARLALVFVSHDIQTVRRMSDRVVTMYLGRIVEQTPAAEACPGGRGTRTPGRCSPPRPACSRRSTRSRWSARSRRRPGRPAAARSAPGAGGPTTCAAPPGPRPAPTTSTFYHCHHPVAAGATDLQLIQERA